LGNKHGTLRIVVTRGDQHCEIAPSLFESFAFQPGDELAVIPADEAAKLPKTGSDINIQIEIGRAIRVPQRFEIYEFKGFKIPVHLISLTGAGPETLDQIGKTHIDNYQRFVGLQRDMTILEVGCGIGRDALQLVDILDRTGQYHGVDVTRDSILWCRDNISKRYENFAFYHFDAEHEIYNPFGAKTTMDFELPVKDRSVDRIVLASVFTHLLEEEVVHYLHEFRRVLKTSGLAYATFFLYSEEAVASARRTRKTPWEAKFEHPYGDGVYGNDSVYPRAAVAFTDEAMRRMIGRAGLRLVRPYLTGWWSGLHDDSVDGQDAAILSI
jgi:ubiquinone/menaquinone biosynthesis C-methylase UbiE